MLSKVHKTTIEGRTVYSSEEGTEIRENGKRYGYLGLAPKEAYGKHKERMMIERLIEILPEIRTILQKSGFDIGYALKDYESIQQLRIYRLNDKMERHTIALFNRGELNEL